MVDVRPWSHVIAMRAQRLRRGVGMARRAGLVAPSILEDVDMGTGSQHNATHALAAARLVVVGTAIISSNVRYCLMSVATGDCDTAGAGRGMSDIPRPLTRHDDE